MAARGDAVWPIGWISLLLGAAALLLEILEWPPLRRGMRFVGQDPDFDRPYNYVRGGCRGKDVFGVEAVLLALLFCII